MREGERVSEGECVCVREREREGEGEKERERESKRESKRERERESRRAHAPAAASEIPGVRASGCIGLGARHAILNGATGMQHRSRLGAGVAQQVSMTTLNSESLTVAAALRASWPHHDRQWCMPWHHDRYRSTFK